MTISMTSRGVAVFAALVLLLSVAAHAAPKSKPAGDTRPPEVTITYPHARTKVSESITVTAKVSDDVGVTRVELYVDDKLVKAGRETSFEITLKPGRRRLRVVAYDAAGNKGRAKVEVKAAEFPWWVTGLPDWLQASWMHITLWQIAGVLLLVFVGLLIRRVVIYLVASQARRLAGRLSSRLESALDKGARPLSGLAMAFIFHVGFPLLYFSDRVELVIYVAVRILAVASGVWLFYRMTEVLGEWLARKAAKTETKLDDQLVPLVQRTLKAFVVVIGSIFVLQNLDVDVASLVAGLGLGGLAFALAAKDTVANFFGAITIFIDRPFQIGDWVVIEKLEGTVEDVGFRTTRIRTFYNSLVTVPNAKLTGTPVDNLGVRLYRRTTTTLNLTYDTAPDQIQAFVEGIRAILAAHPDTRKDYYEVHFKGYGPHSLDIMVYFFVQVPSWSQELKARHEIYLSILKLAGDLRVEFAFPTQTLHVDSFPGKKSGAVKEPGREELTGTVEAYGPGGETSSPRGFPLTHGFYAGMLQRGDSDPDSEEGDSIS